jgi:hypothetical protein
VLIGVQLHDGDGALLRTHFRGQACTFTDAALVRMALRFPLLGLKVSGAILFEAARLYLKGVPVVRRHRSPRYAIEGTRVTQPPVGE